MGVAKGVGVITLVSILMSVLATFIAYQITGMRMEPIVYAVAIAVPVVVAPLASSTVIRLLFELEKAHTRVRTLAVTDELTGAYNRRYFFEIAESEFERAVRHSLPLSVLLIDGDNFKHINDLHGHLCGDQVLQNLCRLCSSTIRQHDVLARYGGEEFILLLPHTDTHGAQVLAERIRSRIADNPLVYEGQQIFFTVSIGIATLESGIYQFSKLVDNADQALYRAKGSGKNCSRFALEGSLETLHEA